MERKKSEETLLGHTLVCEWRYPVPLPSMYPIDGEHLKERVYVLLLIVALASTVILDLG